MDAELEPPVPGLLTLSLSRALALIEPRLPPSIVPPSSLREIKALAEGAPEAFQWTVLEARPTGQPGPIDLLACLIGLPGIRDRVRRSRISTPWPPMESRQKLLDAWCDEDPALDGVQVIWLEWDAPFSRREPFTLPFLDPTFWGPKGAEPLEPAAQVELLERIERLRGKSLAVEETAKVRQVIGALENRGRCLAIADLRERCLPCGYRLFVQAQPTEVLQWLREIEWPGDLELVRKWLPRVVSPWEQAFLQIEVSTHTHDYLGIEPQQTTGNRTELKDRERALVHASSCGLVDKTLIDPILDWAGREPCNIDGREGIIERSLHLKFVLRGGALAETKSYLGWCVEPADTSESP